MKEINTLTKTHAQHNTVTPCMACGTIDTHHVEPGKGPHHAALVCVHCESFIKWIPRPRRSAAALADKQAPWRTDPATEKQLATLDGLRLPHASDISKGEASPLIAAALGSRGR